MRLRKEDSVKVIAGREKGKIGRILKVNRNTNTVILQDLNIMKKAKKPKSQQDRGGIMEIEMPIQASNVMINCKKCGPTRIGFKADGDGKFRICKKCGEKL